jgi:2-polyprenyl-6-methoxyphenol hydroxylase-like FAD-dependent oxidoreductase
VFGDSISALDEFAHGVHVSFERGAPRDFDLVVGADGLHSRTRRLAFGPEAGFYRELGHHFVGFSAPNHLGLHNEARLQNAPGRLAAIYAVGEAPAVQVLLAYKGPERDVAQVFADLGGEVPALLAALRDAGDVYADAVAQIRMPSWSTGRVAVIGDAAYAPSFFSGQGTSLALTGAYVLAGELARAPGDHRSALAAYERTVRGYVERNQALAFTGMRTVVPPTRRDLWMRNTGLRMAPLLARTGLLARLGGGDRAAATALTLPAEFALPEPR